MGVWGRDDGKRSALATDLGRPAYNDYAELLEDVDALAFAVPPSVQATMALEAAAVGKHLLLDKPVADSLDDARALADEVNNEGIASVVFFTGRFQPETRGVLRPRSQEPGGWKGGWARMLASLDAPGNPYSESQVAARAARSALGRRAARAVQPERHARPDRLDIQAVGGEGDLVHLVLTHESGATSTASLSLSAPPDGSNFETGIWGETGTALLPADETSSVDAFAMAATELVAAAESGDSHPIDVSLRHPGSRTPGVRRGPAPGADSDPGAGQ